MSDVDIRLIHILTFIPTEPNYITTKEIKVKLEKLNPESNVSLRTIQRDVTKLCSFLSIIRYEKGWCFTANTKLFQLPNMNFQAALGFKLINKFFERMLPPSITDFLNPYVERAEEILNSDTSKIFYKEWSEKVAIIDTNPLITLKIDKEIVTVVYEALFKKKKLNILEYQKRDLSIESFETDPLGLVFRENNIYLVCSSKKYDYPVIRALHRIKKAEIINQEAIIPKDFKLKSYLKAFDWLVSDHKFKFKAEINKKISNQFYEKMIAEDQKITPCENGNIIIEATIEDSNRIRFFLYSLADNIRIIKPKKLIDEFRIISKNMNSFYSLDD